VPKYDYDHANVDVKTKGGRGGGNDPFLLGGTSGVRAGRITGGGWELGGDRWRLEEVMDCV